MKKLVYDLPLRIFHFLFGFSFLLAFAIGKLGDEDHYSYSFHMLLGLGILFLVLSRIVWWMMGSKHSRLREMPLHPRELFDYLKSVPKKNSKKFVGHNPASSWLGVIMFALAIGAVTTGSMMALEFDSFKLKDIHELLVNGIFLLFLGHVAGIFIHTMKHRELIGLSMVNGKKQDVEESEAITGSSTKTGIAFLLAFILFAGYLIKNFNRETRQLNFLGQTMQLGEAEDQDESKDKTSDKSSELSTEQTSED